MSNTRIFKITQTHEIDLNKSKPEHVVMSHTKNNNTCYVEFDSDKITIYHVDTNNKMTTCKGKRNKSENIYIPKNQNVLIGKYRKYSMNNITGGEIFLFKNGYIYSRTGGSGLWSVSSNIYKIN